jgi:hypothetical protein
VASGNGEKKHWKLSSKNRRAIHLQQIPLTHISPQCNHFPIRTLVSLLQECSWSCCFNGLPQHDRRAHVSLYCAHDVTQVTLWTVCVSNSNLAPNLIGGGGEEGAPFIRYCVSFTHTTRLLFVYFFFIFLVCFLPFSLPPFTSLNRIG